jgi:multiple sugar transport system permease protein
MAYPRTQDRSTPHAPVSAWSRTLRRLWRDRWIYIFLLPTLVFYGLFTFWPIIASYWYSLLDWNGLNRDSQFIGLRNYGEVMRDPLFWRAFRNSLTYMAFVVPLRVSLTLLAALVLNDPRLPFARLFRTALFLPVVTTTAIIGVLMTFILDPASGPVNLALLRLGVIDQPIDFLGRGGTGLYTAIAVDVWKWFGLTLIYWLAALQTVPNELYEAARVDGANSPRVFWHITLPLLRPFAIIITLITAIGALHAFDLILTLTGGGPALSTEVVELYIYRWAFTASVPRLGFASAAAVFFGLTTLILALAQAAALRYVQRSRATYG